MVQGMDRSRGPHFLPSNADERAALSYDKPSGNEDQGFVFAHWPARYLKSRAAELNELVIYPDCDHGRPERVTY